MNIYKNVKKLRKQYDQILKDELNFFLNECVTPMPLILGTLQYMRDIYILHGMNINEDGSENIVVSALASAINEFKLYTNCIQKYINFDSKIPRLKLIEGKSPEEVRIAFQKEKEAHKKAFWKLVSTYMESWFTEYELCI